MPEPAPVTRVILFCRLNMEFRCAQSGRRDNRRSTTQEGQKRPLSAFPQSSGRIVHRAFANPERLDSWRRGIRRSLSLRGRVRVRGNETQPTKTAGLIVQAQLYRLPESELAITLALAP